MIYKYVIHSLIPEYEALGWINTGDLAGTHHGHYADLLMWPHEDQEPVFP